MYSWGEAVIELDRQRLTADLERHEGRRYSAYQVDGKWHIGVGTLIDGRFGGALSDDEIDLILQNRITTHLADLYTVLPWVRELSEARQRALANMAFQLGVPRLLGFTKMLACLQAGDWLGAHTNALDSAWAEQTPARAKEVAAMLRDGT